MPYVYCYIHVIFTQSYPCYLLLIISTTGFGNFIAIYNSVITARILLSWFPQAQGVGFLQPVFQITDPYLNLFRGIIPPVFGLDLSPILAFVTLNLLQSSAVSLAAEIPRDVRKRLEKESWYCATGEK